LRKFLCHGSNCGTFGRFFGRARTGDRTDSSHAAAWHFGGPEKRGYQSSTNGRRMVRRGKVLEPLPTSATPFGFLLKPIAGSAAGQGSKQLVVSLMSAISIRV